MTTDSIKSISDFLYYCTEKYAGSNLFAYGVPGERKFVTYGEFEAAAEKCARRYLEKGYAGGKKIALLGENSYEWILNFFAIEISGNTAVLLDKGQKTDLLKSLAVRMEIDCIVHSDDYEEEAKAAAESAGAERFSIKEMSENDDLNKDTPETADSLEKRNISADPQQSENAFHRRDDLADKDAIIAFTSGTTGVPKGVVLSHYAVAGNTLEGAKVFTLSGSTVLFLPLHHMYGVNTCLLGSMYFGACIYINSSLRYIPQDLMEAKPSYLFLVPMVMGSVLKVLQGMHAAGMPVPEKIASGGAPINVSLIENFNALGTRIYNAYGITECAPGIAVSSSPAGAGKTSMKCITGVMIGDPDENGCGEVLVKGPNVMKEYFGQKEETEKALAGGWFHTGDAGILEDGDMLTITGRIKNLIVLPNGENIAPEELETELLNVPMVGDVIVKQDGSDLVAEIYPANAGKFTEEDEKALRSSILEFTKKYPAYKRITKVEIRKVPFEKTTTLKIKR